MKSKQSRMTIMYKLSMFAMDLLRTGNASGKKKKVKASVHSFLFFFCSKYKISAQCLCRYVDVY